MGEIIHFIPLENMSDQGLLQHARLIEDNIEAGIIALRQIQTMIAARHKLPYDDFHDIFPEDPA